MDNIVITEQPVSPNQPAVEHRAPPERTAVKKYIAESIKQAPNGVVSKIAAESIPAGARPVDFFGIHFPKKGILPQGDTLTIAKEVLQEAPVLKRKDGGDRIKDLTQVGIGVLDQVDGKTLFKVVPGRGLQISMASLTKAGEKVSNAIGDLAYFRAEGLLLGLYAAGANSVLDRRQAEQIPRNMDVRYPHSTGEVTVFKMNSVFANRLTTICEDSLLATTGKI